MVDFFLLLMLPNAGDELQGIKRGIMEMADAILINKADGDNVMQARTARSQYELALHLFPPTESHWIPVVETCSARTGEGISRLWEVILKYQSLTQQNGYWNAKRLSQARELMMKTIEDGWLGGFFRDEQVAGIMKVMERELAENKISSYLAAQKVLDAFRSK